MASRQQHKHRRIQKHKPAIDKLVYFAVIFGPLMTLPQVYDIWILDKNEVSVITWSSYFVIACIWLAYGYKHKDKPIMIVQTLWLILDVGILLGVFLT